MKWNAVEHYCFDLLAHCMVLNCSFANLFLSYSFKLNEYVLENLIAYILLVKPGNDVNANTSGMSDSDDTDALLLIPPDLFYVHSDSEDNFFCDVTREQNSEFEKMVFHDLIDHVSELENRVHVIEHSDRLNSYCSDKISYNQYWDRCVDTFHDFDSLYFSRYNRRQSRSFENLRNHPVQDSAVHTSATPVKYRIPFSLPTTPSSGSHKSQPLESSIRPDSLANQPFSDEVKKITGVSTTTMKSITSSEDTSSPKKIMAVDSGVKETTLLDSTQDSGTPSKNNAGQDLMSEIDEFLNSTKKNKPKDLGNFGVADNTVHQQHRNVASTSRSVFMHAEAVPSAKQYGLDTGMRLALSDIAKLLDEVKTTETEITQKLNVAKKPVPVKNLSLQTSVFKNASVPKFHVSQSSTSAGVSDLLTSTIEEKTDESSSGHVETDRLETECNVALTKNTSNTNRESSFRGSGLKSARRRLDLGYEFPACASLQSKMIEVDNRESPVNSSNTTYASLQNSVASISQTDKVVLTGRQDDSQDLDKCSSNFTNNSCFARDDQAMEVNANSELAFSCRTYPPLVTNRHGASVANSLSYTQSLQREGRLGLTTTVQHGASEEVAQEGRSQKIVPSADNSAADHNGQVPLKLAYENDPPKTRAVQGSGYLLSLSELWSGQGLSGDYEANPVRRLEEERYRRQHCERLIQQLQARLLEEQQKVSVAVEVDRAKDRAILQLQAGWRQLVGHWHELEEQRHSVTNTLHLERESFQRDLGQASQRVQHLERELSQMLDLARDYKEKNEAINRESTESKIKHERELQKAAAKAQELEQSLLSASAALKDAQVKEEELVGQLLSAQKEVHKGNEVTEAVRRELQQLQEMSARLEAELVAAKEEKTSLQLKLKEEKNRSSLLDKQKKALLVSLEDIRKKEKALRDEGRVAAEKLERTKLELRDHYQQQVEKMVQEKMREFQAQLDADEASMRSELQQRERAITELAAQQIKQIADKHKVELQLLEEKHQEEKQLMHLQISQSDKKVAELQAKFAQVQSQRGQVAERLHAIMEAQWRESVRVIAGGSPLHLPRLGAADQALEAPFLTTHRLEHSASSSTTDSFPFAQDSQLTFRQRASQSQQPHRGDELKNYIAMLLDCKPGNPVGDLIPTSECGHTAAEQEYLNVRTESQSQLNQHPQLGHVAYQDLPQAASAGTNKDGQAGKPPWK